MQKIVFLIIPILFLIACTKNKGQTKPDVPDGLDRLYCNDPIAVNYNDFFPGTPDNTTCIYPKDKFIGNWHVIDSTFKMDHTLLATDTRTITITYTGDTAKSKLNIMNWNTCSTPLKITANKYGKAIIDNLLTTDSGQVLCNDTLVGYFQLTDTNDATMNVSITVNSTMGNYYHKAQATKL